MENESENSIQKPVGVYVLTIAVFLRFGLIQFFNEFFALRDEDVKTPLLIIMILLGLSAFTAGAAVWALIGDNLGRITLLAFVSLNILWTVFSTILAVSYNESAFNTINFDLGLIQPVIWLVVCWWYFTRKNVVEYYQQNS